MREIYNEDLSICKTRKEYISTYYLFFFFFLRKSQHIRFTCFFDFLLSETVFMRQLMCLLIITLLIINNFCGSHTCHTSYIKFYYSTFMMKIKEKDVSRKNEN